MENQTPAPAAPTAMAILRGDPSHSRIMGEATFTPYGRGTLVVIRLLGLPAPGFLGFHIHEKGDCSTGGDVPFSSAGGHYDPHGVAHPWHAGDLPSILATPEGTAFLAVYTDRFRPSDVIGRAVMIHEMADDFHSQPAGDSGMRIACGVIREA
ncbi:MAG: superoxide dismutase family protein [Oscillospiraceae bacterium]|nr:superoxide dismutase family protein [Oscillospiraceae bacterium]